MNLINSNLFKTSSNLLFTLIIVTSFIGNLFAQQYPPNVTMSHVNYNPPAQLPNYLAPFIEENFGNKVTRVSSLNSMNGDSPSLRHEYVTNQPWNADGSKIQLYQADQSYILDAATYEIIDGPVDIERYWSNVDPNKTYYFYSNKFLTTNIVTGIRTTEYDFSNDGFVWVSINGDGYLSHDDELVVLQARKSNGDYYVILFNTVTKEVMSSLNVGSVQLDNVKISPSKQYIVICGGYGSGNTQGTNVYDLNLNFLRHIYDRSSHNDLGVDIDGNDVWVGNHDNWIRTLRLDGVGNTSQGLKYIYVSGGHVSCRNVDRSGWAYITDHGASSNIGDYTTFREIFAVKLDNKPNGEVTVNRFTKHYSNISLGYAHQPHAIPNHDGTKVMFASAMEDQQTEQQNYPFAWIVESQNSDLAVEDEILDNTKFSIFPNPTNGEVNLELDGFYDITSIYVTDIMGKILYSESMNIYNSFNFSKTLQLNSFPKGIYFITIKGEGEPLTKKIILK